jgi:predicted nucleic acid-binding Zn ribbon protein
MLPIERFARWIARPSRCAGCGKIVERGVAFCAEECEL